MECVPRPARCAPCSDGTASVASLLSWIPQFVKNRTDVTVPNQQCVTDPQDYDQRHLQSWALQCFGQRASFRETQWTKNLSTEHLVQLTINLSYALVHGTFNQLANWCIFGLGSATRGCLEPTVTYKLQLKPE